VSRTTTAADAPLLANPYFVKEVRFPSGERMPLMVRRSTGVAIEAPCYWITSERRPLGIQANTLQQELRALTFLYLWGDKCGTDPVAILQSPAFLTLNQLNDLDRFCRNTASAAIRQALAAASGNVVRITGGCHAKSAALPGRMQLRNRMASIHSFMDHVSCDHLSRLAPGTEAHRIYQHARSEMLEKWAGRCKSLDPSDLQDLRKGLDEAASLRLREVIRPDSPDNAWQPEVRHRNGLMVLMLWSLGLRRGELLALETRDIRFTADQAFVQIVRRPDNRADHRRPRPSVKTLGRELLLEQGLADLLRAYIMGQRREHPAARKHPFVFVSAADGSPLGLSAFNKLFDKLRLRVTDLPADLSPHIMRHSWNDTFSKLSDRANPRRTDVERTQEERMRAYLMGWSANSKMAVRYSRRWLAEEANKRLLSLQQSQVFVGDPTPDPPGDADDQP